MDGAYRFDPGVYFATVVERSVDDPAPPASIFYTVEMRIPGAQTFRAEGVVPSNRSTDNEPNPSDPLELYPFAIGQRVLVSIDPAGSRAEIQIHDREAEAYEECDAG
jgi:hypothetical protein